MFFTPATQKADQCDLCGCDPACAHACPTNAIEVAEVENAPWFAPLSQHLQESFQATLPG